MISNLHCLVIARYKEIISSLNYMILGKRHNICRPPLCEWDEELISGVSVGCEIRGAGIDSSVKGQFSIHYHILFSLCYCLCSFLLWVISARNRNFCFLIIFSSFTRSRQSCSLVPGFQPSLAPAPGAQLSPPLSETWRQSWLPSFPCHPIRKFCTCFQNGSL